MDRQARIQWEQGQRDLINHLNRRLQKLFGELQSQPENEQQLLEQIEALQNEILELRTASPPT